MWHLLRDKLLDVLKAVAPLIGAVVVLQITIVQAPAELFLQFLAGSVLAVVGMLLLFVGIDLGILPMGRFVGAELPKKGSLALILAVTFSLGFATTIAEPDRGATEVLDAELSAVLGRDEHGVASINGHIFRTGDVVLDGWVIIRINVTDQTVELRSPQGKTITLTRQR